MISTFNPKRGNSKFKITRLQRLCRSIAGRPACNALRSNAGRQITNKSKILIFKIQNAFKEVNFSSFTSLRLCFWSFELWISFGIWAFNFDICIPRVRGFLMAVYYLLLVVYRQRSTLGLKIPAKKSQTPCSYILALEGLQVHLIVRACPKKVPWRFFYASPFYLFIFLL